MNVRTLTGSDAAAFQALRLRALEDCPEAFASSYAEECDLSLEEIASRLVPDESHCVFGAFLEMELVGVLGFQREAMRKVAHKAFMWGMYVSPAHRRNGIGRQLLIAAIELAESRPGLRQVSISVNSTNSAAIALYEHLGFRSYGVEPGALLIDDVPYDETHMVLRIRGGLRIREEQSQDIAAIEAVTVAAFLDAAHTDHTEQFIVSALRKSGQLSGSLVADSNGTVVGHIALSPVSVSDGATDWYGLGPVSVAPEHQGHGIGAQLIRRALSELRKLGASGCVVLGDPVYYSRFGFKVEPSLILPGVPPEYFQIVSFGGAPPSGTVTYHESFAAQR